MRRMRPWQPTKRQMRIVVEIIVFLTATIFIYSQTRKYLATMALSPLWQTAAIIGGLVLLWIFIGGYYYKLNIVGFSDYTYKEDGKQKTQRGKTLWDWLELLIVPAVLAGGVLLFNAQNERTQQELAIDTQHEAALQAYINNMSDHLLDDNLRTSREDAEIRSVANTRTLSTLRQLDGARKGQVVRFLAEVGLITNTSTSPSPIISLDGADLRDAELPSADLTFVELEQAQLHNADLRDAELPSADLKGADLTGADLSCAQLHNADLRGADLPSADLRDAYLRSSHLTGADLTGADLTGADLSKADLTGAKVTDEQLATCKYLYGATLPDGTTVPDHDEEPPPKGCAWSSG